MNDADAILVDLLARARAGDRSALGALLDRHRDYLRVLAREQLDPAVRARIDASDVVQQTCLSVFRQIKEFDGTDAAQFVAWLRKIHERNVLNVVRDQQAGRRAADREMPLDERDVAGRDSTPSRLASRDEERGRLQEAIELLPADEREALRLRYLEGRTLPQTADALGLTKDALVWLLRRALKSVKAKLDG